MSVLSRQISVAHDLLVLRHGETVWNRAGQFQGKKNSPLTEKGRAQARRQGEILHRVRPSLADYTLYASPLGRAQETARLAFGDPAFATDDRLAEIGLGRWEGTTREQRLASDPNITASFTSEFDFYVNAPDGEGLTGLADRIGDFLLSLDGPAVVVSHKVALSVMRALITGHQDTLSCELAPAQGSILHLSRDKAAQYA